MKDPIFLKLNPNKVSLEILQNSNFLEQKENSEMKLFLQRKFFLQNKLQEKYFLAGHSARWMFFFNSNDAKNDIDSNLVRIKNVEQLLDGLSGEASDQTINHLFSNINGNVVIVSQYVARALAKANYENFIKIATLHSRNLNNVSFDGWVFQMDFLFHLKKAQSGNQFIKLISETWKVLNCIDFFDESELDNKNIVDGSWIIPSKINHGCYDAAQFTSQSDKNILRIVQLTVGNLIN